MRRMMLSLHASLLGASMLVSTVAAQITRTRTTTTTTVIQQPTEGATLSPIAPGPAPMGVSVTGTPASATVVWQAMPNAVHYSIGRFLKANPSCCTHAVQGVTATTWTDNTGGLQWPGVYVYTVTANYADGAAGSTQFEWTRPDPSNPTSLTATPKGQGVELTWPAVAGASYYLLWGPGLADATRAMGTLQTVQSVPPGDHEYVVGAYFDPGSVSTAAAQFTKGRVSVRSATGTYRVTINGFTANHATSEDPGNWDGVSDEVYASAFVQVLDRGTGAQLGRPVVVESRVHGDVSKWPDRIRAGTVTASGGIGPGNRVPDNSDPAIAPTGQPSVTTFPLVLYQGPLTAGKEVVVVRPVLWEADGNRSAFDKWSTQLAEMQPQTTFDLVRSGLEKSDLEVVVGKPLLSAVGNVTTQVLFAGHYDIGAGRDRPIGLTPKSSALLHWLDRLVPITKEKIDALLDSPYGGSPVGIIAIRLVDKDGGDLPHSGDYTLYLRVERLP